MENKYFCHDCKKEIKVKGNEITDGVDLVYKNGKENIEIIKCLNCYEKSKELSGYQECEVYSRVVGYIRPTKQWNTSKLEEYKERKNFKI
jgi:anaerobic ribonucleoside-triphosphate reductase